VEWSAAGPAQRANPLPGVGQYQLVAQLLLLSGAPVPPPVLNLLLATMLSRRRDPCPWP